jgi:hypothetical protein
MALIWQNSLKVLGNDKLQGRGSRKSQLPFTCGFGWNGSLDSPLNVNLRRIGLGSPYPD